MGMREGEMPGVSGAGDAPAAPGVPYVSATSSAPGVSDGKGTPALASADEGALAQASELPVAGLGVDIVAIERMRQVLARTPRFKKRVYTDGEQAYCDAYKKKAHLHYATHFAAKEAVAKALGTGFAEGVAPRDIEVVHDENGRPHVVLHGKARALAEEQGVLEMHLSLSRTHETAVANALAATAQTRPQPKEEPGRTPREELACEFKKLRGMLDNLEDAMRAGLADLEDAPPAEEQGEEGAEPQAARGAEPDAKPEMEPDAALHAQPGADSEAVQGAKQDTAPDTVPDTTPGA